MTQKAQGWFIAGTDTGVGKTRIACTLIQTLAHAGRTVVGMKPVASGCSLGPDGLRNADAQALLACGNVQADYHDINPYALATATAPHLAARAAGVALSMDQIIACYQRLAAQADYVVVEGVGGWRVPLGPHVGMDDVARVLGLPVILVVGIRLGAINHALLSMESIQRARVSVCGWIANHLDPDPVLADYPRALQALLDAPLLGEIAYSPGTEARMPADWAMRLLG